MPPPKKKIPSWNFLISPPPSPLHSKNLLRGLWRVSKQHQNNRRTERRLGAKTTKKPYRLNEKQKSFLVSKFNIGQDTGRKMDPEIVAREGYTRRAPVLSELLTPGEVSSFFSRLTAKTLKQPAGKQFARRRPGG